MWVIDTWSVLAWAACFIVLSGKVHSSIHLLINWHTVHSLPMRSILLLLITLKIMFHTRRWTPTEPKNDQRFYHILLLLWSNLVLMCSKYTHTPRLSHISVSSGGESSTSWHQIVLLKSVSVIVWSQGRAEMAIGCNRIWFRRPLPWQPRSFVGTCEVMWGHSLVCTRYEGQSYGEMLQKASGQHEQY